MGYSQHALRSLILKLNLSGTIEVLKDARLYEGCYGFTKLQVYVPYTQNTEAPLCTAFKVTVDEEGNEVQGDKKYNLLFVGEYELADDEAKYLLFEALFPKEFTDEAGDLAVEFNYYDTAPTIDSDGSVVNDENGVAVRHTTTLLASARYITTIYPGGIKETGLELEIDSAEAAQINENAMNIAELQTDMLRIISRSDVVQETGTELYKVMSQAAVTAELDGIKSDHSELAEAVTKHLASLDGSVAELKEADEALDENKVDRTDILQATGTATDKIMSQAAVTDEINGIKNSYVKSEAVGAANGVAPLDEKGLVPASRLPSYVDDVLEYSSISEFPATGETGKIYVDITTNLTYRWSGSQYTEISQSLAIGTTAVTAAAGNHTHSEATQSAAGFMSSADKTKLDSVTAGATGHGVPTGGKEGQWLEKTSSEDYEMAWKDKPAAVTATITLTASDWSNGSQTITVDGVTAKSTVWISTVTEDDDENWAAGGCRLDSKAEDTLTFTCKITPSADILVNVWVAMCGDKGESGLSIYYSTAEDTTTATTSIALSTIDVPTGHSVSVGDIIIANPNGSYLYKVTAVSETAATVSYLHSFKGDTGETGAQGEAGVDALAYKGVYTQLSGEPASGDIITLNSFTLLTRTPVAKENFVMYLEHSGAIYCAIMYVSTVTSSSVKLVINTLWKITGEDGSNISTIEKTATEGLTDTYTITLTDGTTSTFTVTNGKSISGVEKTATDVLVDTYTITFNDGTTSTFEVTNGYGAPTGGTSGQHLIKNSDTDYDYGWEDGLSLAIHTESELQTEAYVTTEEKTVTGLTFSDGTDTDVSGNYKYYILFNPDSSSGSATKLQSYFRFANRYYAATSSLQSATANSGNPAKIILDSSGGDTDGCTYFCFSEKWWDDTNDWDRIVFQTDTQHAAVYADVAKTNMLDISYGGTTKTITFTIVDGAVKMTIEE